MGCKSCPRKCNKERREGEVSSYGYCKVSVRPKVARAALQAKAAEPVSEKEAEDVLAALPDGNQVSDWARSSMALCLKTGLTEAKPDGAIVPLEKVRRSEIAGIIYNLYEKTGDKR